MKAVVVYESMYGNTHLVADAIGAGLRERAGCRRDRGLPVDGATPRLLGSADLVVVGGPTHAHGMSRPTHPQGGGRGGEQAGEPSGGGPRRRRARAARVVRRARRARRAPGERGRVRHPPRCKACAHRARVQGDRASAASTRAAPLVADPESFLVTKGDHLADHEEQRAREWGAGLATAPELAGRSQLFPRMMPLRPAETSVCSAFATWLGAVPRIWRTPSRMLFTPWM